MIAYPLRSRTCRIAPGPSPKFLYYRVRVQRSWSRRALLRKLGVNELQTNLDFILDPNYIDVQISFRMKWVYIISLRRHVSNSY
jgi:hypothetical protein